MHLAACSPPEDTIAMAPLTALCDSTCVTRPMVQLMADGTELAAFWGHAGDAYYVRVRGVDSEAWYRMVDEPSPVIAEQPADPPPAVLRGRDAALRVSVRRTQGADGRPATMLTGVYRATRR